MAFSFPQYRSEDWLKILLESGYSHPEVLSGVDLTPEYMAANPSAALYRNKSLAAKEQIKRTLFRHALFKIQNIEVVDGSCKSDRILLGVRQSTESSLSARVMDKISNHESTRFVCEEMWTINRCGKDREYAVRYYREGDDGFSTRVVPVSFSDKINMLRYYFS
jgi:hypothetical protein